MNSLVKAASKVMVTGAVAGAITAAVVAVGIIGFVIYVRFTGVHGVKD